MSSESKKLSEEHAKEQAKKSGEKCDYLHPEECKDDSKDNLDKTRKEVEKVTKESRRAR